MNWIIIVIRFLLNLCKFDSHLTTYCIRLSFPFAGKQFKAIFKAEYLIRFRTTICICHQNHTIHTVLLKSLYLFKKINIHQINSEFSLFLFFITINCMEKRVSNSLPFRPIRWKTKALISCIYLCSGNCYKSRKGLKPHVMPRKVI